MNAGRNGMRKKKHARRGLIPEAEAIALGSMIYAKRMEYNITQQAVALFIQRSKSAISEAEHGKKRLRQNYERILEAIPVIAANQRSPVPLGASA